MPKRKSQESPKEQSERFRREARELIDAGELNPIESGRGVDRIVSNAGLKRKQPPSGDGG